MMNLPPGLFYFMGAVLIVFGALRAYHLGWKRPETSIADEEGSAARVREQRRHVRFGIIWVVLGLVLVVSTIIKFPR